MIRIDKTPKYRRKTFTFRRIKLIIYHFQTNSNFFHVETFSEKKYF